MTYLPDHTVNLVFLQGGTPTRRLRYVVPTRHGVVHLRARHSSGRAIRLFNDGNMRRDFTYIDDAVDDVVALIDRPAQSNPAWSGSAPDPASSSAPWRIYNVGNGRPIAITRIVDVLEHELGRKAVRELAPIQPGDVSETCADVDDLAGAIGVRPRTTIEDGIKIFVAWFRDYHESASVRPTPAVTT